LLANVTSNLIPLEGINSNAFSIELIFRLSIPDNVTNRMFFDDNQKIINFLHMEDTFQSSVLDRLEHEESLHNTSTIERDQLVERMYEGVSSIP